MATDGERRTAVIEAAAAIMRREGIGAATYPRVAKEAGVPQRVVRRLFPDAEALRREVLTRRLRSEVAELVARAAADPDQAPPLSVLVEAGHRLFAAPQLSWADADLEALVRARANAELRDLARERIAQRTDNAHAVVRHAERTGELDPAISEEALTYFTMTLSVGLALLDSAATVRPSTAEWDALMARIGLALAPPQTPDAPEYETGAPWRLRVDLPDRPAALSRLIGALGALHIYAVEVRVDDPRDGRRGVYLALSAPEDVSPDVILAAAGSIGDEAHITVGTADDGRDILARTLDGATYLVKHPDEAPRIAGMLVGASEVEVIDATEGLDDQANVLRLQWTPDRHVLVHRDWGPFSRSEQVRASALLRLSSALSRTSGTGQPMGWIDEVRGGTVWIRLARPEDAAAVAAMHERSSEQTRYQRYFSLQEWRDLQLRRLSGGHRGATLVVQSRDGAIVGLGNVFPDTDAPDEDAASASSTAEIALLVEDAYQGMGIGRVLLVRMLEVAPLMGFTDVVAHVLAGNAAMRHLLDQTGLTWRTTVSQGVAESRAPLP